MSAASERPYLRVVRGNPTDVELAALTAVVAAVGSTGAVEPATTARSTWSDRSRAVRGVLRPGPGAWRASTLPR
ncbi:acyl-CoA carboxylase subunit epsilon [Actinosynnema sp. NPDC020468]|uniref:acyl-CoA carboxylase subunit epsilon n=1 Tax=Actinosynnema sp. NPDC020468 TaxID=3154488 RepID=UPI0033DB094C